MGIGICIYIYMYLMVYQIDRVVLFLLVWGDRGDARARV